MYQQLNLQPQKCFLCIKEHVPLCVGTQVWSQWSLGPGDPREVLATGTEAIVVLRHLLWAHRSKTTDLPCLPARQQ